MTLKEIAQRKPAGGTFCVTRNEWRACPAMTKTACPYVRACAHFNEKGDAEAKPAATSKGKRSIPHAQDVLNGPKSCTDMPNGQKTEE